jgi:hypothetical protein
MGNEEYDRFKTVRPRNQRGFDVLFVGPLCWTHLTPIHAGRQICEWS